MSGGGAGPSDEDPYAVQLNLVPLIDVLCNILFFLLVGFASTEVTYEGDLLLPVARSSSAIQIKTKVVLSDQELKVNDVRVAKVVEGKIDAPVEGDKIVPLYEKLNQLKKELQEQTGGIQKDDDVVFLFAHKGTPFTTLSPIMKTAAMAGFPNFRFAIVRQ